MIGDDDDNPFVIPDNAGPITLVLTGGNLYIKDNIEVGEGSSLGVMVLRSRHDENKKKEISLSIQM